MQQVAGELFSEEIKATRAIPPNSWDGSVIILASIICILVVRWIRAHPSSPGRRLYLWVGKSRTSPGGDSGKVLIVALIRGLVAETLIHSLIAVVSFVGVALREQNRTWDRDSGDQNSNRHQFRYFHSDNLRMSIGSSFNTQIFLSIRKLNISLRRVGRSCPETEALAPPKRRRSQLFGRWSG